MFAVAGRKGKSESDVDDEEIEALQKQLFDLRVKQATKQDLKTSDFKKLRKDIARRKTAQTSGDWSAVERMAAASDSAASGDSVAMFAVSGEQHQPEMNDEQKRRDGLGDVTGSTIRYNPEIAKPAKSKRQVYPELTTKRGRKGKWKEAPNPEYDDPIYELKKKLLMTRFMKAVNHPDYRSSDFKKLRKAIARLKTAKRFDEMREQGIDPYARQNYNKRERKRMATQKARKAENKRRELARAEGRKIRQQKKEERRLQRLKEQGEVLQEETMSS
jgi:ribosomal protein L29